MTRSPHLQAVARVALALLGLVLVLVVLAPSSAPVAVADSGDGSSALTVHGSGRFSDLAVTVSQTNSLVDQVVDVSWTGGTQTQPTSGNFAIDYLQIMQCWGNDPSGPDRTQCAFGGKAAFDQRGGDFVATRQVNYGSLVDPDETLKQAPGSTDTAFVPFTSVSGKTVTGNANEFFDSTTSNEIPFARSRPDGSGEQLMELQTVRENSGLGCGALVNGAPRACWLVLVPRDDKEVDGSTRTAAPNNQLVSSPLSASNWAHRVVVPLHFAPASSVCPLGSAERPTVGSEMVAEVVGRWQPVLCANNGPVYGYSQVGDQVARRQLLSEQQPGLGYVTSPIPPAQVPAKANMVYAPVAMSGLTIAFNIETQPDLKAPAQVLLREGRPITDMRLNQRLVAKLLTQSYSLAVDPTAAYLNGNPADLTRDPEFLELNPEFKDLNFRGIDDIITQAGVSDETQLLWEWIASDDDAMNFLAGQPDPWGMKVNPFYQGMSAPRGDFPKSDPYCHTYPQPGPAPLCTLDAHPYAGSLHEAAQAAGRGDSLARAAWDPNAIPPQYKKTPLQLSGKRALIAFTDTASAARYGLVPAKLRNAAGQYVAPTVASMTSALDDMQPDEQTPAVLTPDAGTTDPLAYPLTEVSYAVTNPPALTKEDAADYAALIRFAVDRGQVPGTDPGQLPDGYVPLPTALREQALTAATEIHDRLGPATASPSPSASPSPTSSSGGGSSGSGSSGFGGSSGGSVTGGGLPAASSASPTASPSSTTSVTASTAPVAQAIPTPADPMPATRVAVVVIAGLALAAAAAGPLMPRAARWWTTRRTH